MLLYERLKMFFEIILRLFGIIFLGYLIGKIKKIDLRNIIQSVTNFIIYLIIPCFIFTAMLEKEFEFFEFKKIVIATVFVVLIMGVIVFFVSKLAKVKFREVCLPIMFMNSGYMTLPLVSFVLPAGLYAALIYNATIGFLMFTLGIFLVSIKKSFFSTLQEPVLYATILGIIFNFLKIQPPFLLIKMLKTIGLLAMPSMLVIMGYKLNFVKTKVIKLGIWGTALRIGGGFLLALGITKVFGISGVVKDVIIIVSSMPAAITSYIFGEKYEANPDFAASVILISTAVSIITIPIVLRFLRI